MRNIRSLFDKTDDHSSSEEEDTEAFAGGHRSGLAIRYPGQKPSRCVRIYSYTNGFRIEDGPFRPLSDVSNQLFMDTLRAGNVPDELAPAVDSVTSALNVELKQFEAEFDESHPITSSSLLSETRPTTTTKPFAGQSQTLGDSAITARGNVPAAIGDTFPALQLASGCSSVAIQFRLPNGSRITRSFDSRSPGSMLASYISSGLIVDPGLVLLSTGFPPKPLSDDELMLSLEDLKLAGASIQVTMVHTKK